MSDNGKLKDKKESAELIFAVKMIDNKHIDVKINTNKLTLLLTGLKMAELQIENMIIASQTPKDSPIVMPQSVMNRLRS